MVRRKRNILRGAAVAGVMLGASLLMPATVAHASATDCHTAGLSNGGRAWCNSINGGTQIRVVVYCSNSTGTLFRTVYGPWRTLPGAYSDAYCGVNYHVDGYAVGY